MKVNGRMLTPQEAERTKAHYRKNAGVKWDLTTLAKCVTEGADAANSDAKTKEILESGMKMCYSDGGA